MRLLREARHAGRKPLRVHSERAVRVALRQHHTVVEVDVPACAHGANASYPARNIVGAQQGCSSKHL